MGDTYGDLYTHYMSLSEEKKRESNKRLEEEENRRKNRSNQEKWNEYLKELNRKYWDKIDEGEIE